ncbi:MAG: toll/interleukin-1 receptor domain-containing protein [Bacteroidaceae bacterium]|nr:toll/interleukin-1 receptor domain-containing protein [Bacteroidaceae bacterium]
MENNRQYKYYAFISYNSKDTKWGKRLQRKLEGYKMPATLCSEHGWERKPIKPVFFAPADIGIGVLDEELKARLRASRNLIVICSPNSAKSKWVGEEIAYFHSLGRTANIHFFIVDGIPNSSDSATECFNPVVKELGIPEILGANIHEKNYRWPWMNRQRAYVQLVTTLLGVEFDSIWKRHKRLLVNKILLSATLFIAVLAVLFAVWTAGKPVDVEVRLDEVSVKNTGLPPLKDAVVTLELENEIKSDTLPALSSKCLFKNIPSRFVGERVRLKVAAKDFLPVDTFVELSGDLKIAVRRDPSVYGNVNFRLWNPVKEQFLPGVVLKVDGHETVTDAAGAVSLTIPLEMQKQYYIVETSLSGEQDTIFMPCGRGVVVEVE